MDAPPFHVLVFLIVRRLIARVNSRILSCMICWWR